MNKQQLKQHAKMQFIKKNYDLNNFILALNDIDMEQIKTTQKLDELYMVEVCNDRIFVDMLTY